MSMIGLATSPGTDVDPTCSTRTAASPSADAIRARSIRKASGHPGSYSASTIVALCGRREPTVTRCKSASLTGGLRRFTGRLPLCSDGESEITGLDDPELLTHRGVDLGRRHVERHHCHLLMERAALRRPP